MNNNEQYRTAQDNYGNVHKVIQHYHGKYDLVRGFGHKSRVDYSSCDVRQERESSGVYTGTREDSGGLAGENRRGASEVYAAG